MKMKFVIAIIAIILFVSCTPKNDSTKDQIKDIATQLTTTEYLKVSSPDSLSLLLEVDVPLSRWSHYRTKAIDNWRQHGGVIVHLTSQDIKSYAQLPEEGIYFDKSFLFTCNRQKHLVDDNEISHFFDLMQNGQILDNSNSKYWDFYQYVKKSAKNIVDSSRSKDDIETEISEKGQVYMKQELSPSESIELRMDIQRLTDLIK